LKNNPLVGTCKRRKVYCFHPNKTWRWSNITWHVKKYSMWGIAWRYITSPERKDACWLQKWPF